MEKTFPKELRAAINDAVERALFDNDGGVKFSEIISKALVVKLETTLQRDLSSRLGTMFEKSLSPMVTKLEERVQASIEKSIQKESRASQQEIVKKIEDLTAAISIITEYIKNDTTKTVANKNNPESSLPQVPTRKEKMAEQFKAGKYSAGIETVSLPFDCTDM